MARLFVLLVSLQLVFAPFLNLKANAAPQTMPTLGESGQSEPYFYQVSEIDGQPITFLGATISKEYQAELAKALLKSAPNQSAILIESNRDTLFKELKKQGLIKGAPLYYMAPIDSIPLLENATISNNLRDDFKLKIKSITDYCKRKKKGLLWSVIYGGAVGGFTWYSSADVQAGLSVFAAVTAWSSFISTQSERWEKILNNGSAAMTGLFGKITSLFGHKLSNREKVASDITGQFLVSWAASAAAVGLTFWQAGTLTDLIQVLYYGFIANYNIWDSTVLKRFREARISENSVSNYYSLQMAFGTLLEVASYLHVPITQMALASTTVAGVVYLALGDKLEAQLKNKNGQRTLAQSKPSTSCEGGLTTPSP